MRTILPPRLKIWIVLLIVALSSSCSKDKSDIVQPLADTIYAVNETGEVYAVDAENGLLKWVYQAKGYIDASPIVSKGVLYIGDTRGIFVAIDAVSGKEKWQVDLRGRHLSSAIVSDNIVYVTIGTACFALRCSDGSILWKFETTDSIYGGPAIAGEMVYFGDYGNHLYAVDRRTGKEKWKFGTSGEIIETPIVRNGVVYVNDSFAGVYALNAVTGQMKWKFDTNGRSHGSPVITDSELYFIQIDELISVDLNTGKQKWSSEINLKAGIASPTPAISNGLVYVQGLTYTKDVSSNWLCAIDAKNGNQKWRYEANKQNISNYSRWFSPTANEGYVYTVSWDGYIRSIDANTGKEQWVLETVSSFGGSVCIASAKGRVLRGLGQIDTFE